MDLSLACLDAADGSVVNTAARNVGSDLSSDAPVLHAMLFHGAEVDVHSHACAFSIVVQVRCVRLYSFTRIHATCLAFAKTFGLHRTRSAV